MKVKLVVESRVAPGAPDDPQMVEKDGKRWWPVGSIIEDPRAYKLVALGVAEPADEECAQRVAMTPAQMKEAQRRQAMFSKGIQPEDYDRYESGEILGYDENGEDIPGPNYQEDEDE